MLIQSINNDCSTLWRIQSLVRDIKILASQFHSISFKHIWREANFAANATTNLGHTALIASWTANFPDTINKLKPLVLIVAV